LAPAVLAQTSPDEIAIRGVIDTMWKNVAERKIDSSGIHPDGAVQATSAGGFWRTLSRQELVSQFQDDPSTMKFTPHHVQVRFLGSKRDVAFVSFYLSGSIVLADGGSIDDYRTRASIVLEKVGGTWVQSAAHYSPLFGGSGVLPD
jgi:hypothetical protein